MTDRTQIAPMDQKALNSKLDEVVAFTKWVREVQESSPLNRSAAPPQFAKRLRQAALALESIAPSHLLLVLSEGARQMGTPVAALENPVRSYGWPPHSQPVDMVRHISGILHVLAHAYERTLPPRKRGRPMSWAARTCTWRLAAVCKEHNLFFRDEFDDSLTLLLRETFRRSGLPDLSEEGLREYLQLAIWFQTQPDVPLKVSLRKKPPNE